MDLTLAAAADQFHARARKGATPEAMEAESREIAKFVAGLGAATPVARVTPGQIEDYQRRFVPNWRAEDDMAKAIRSNRLAVEHLRVVQAFLRWLRTQEHITADLAKALRLPAKASE